MTRRAWNSEAVDAALAAWPFLPEGQRLGKIRQTLEIVARSGALEAADAEKLLAAPLPQSPEESHNCVLPGGVGARRTHAAEETPRSPDEALVLEANPMSTQSRERTRTSLKDLAKLAGEMNGPPSSKAALSGVHPTESRGSLASVPDPKSSDDSDSGLVDMAAVAKADPKAPERAKETPLAATGLFEDDGMPSVRPSAAPDVSVPPAAIAIPGPAPVPNLASMGAEPAEKKNGKGGVILLGLVAAAAVAAGSFFVFQITQGARATAGTASARSEVKAAAAPVAVEEAPKAPEVAPTPAEPEAPVAVNTPAPAHRGGKGRAAKAAEPKPEPSVDPKFVVKSTPTTPTDTTSLSAAMRAAAGPGESSHEAAAPKNEGPAVPAGSVPQRPSQGAVTGALNAVLPAARACMQPDDGTARASVVFGSAGTVQSVSVSGASGQADACIKAALGKAKIAPFAEATYPANINVRPL